MHLTYDTRDAYIKTIAHDRVIVHATREWLAFFAAHPDEPIDMTEYACWFKDDTPVKAPRTDEDK